MRYAQPSIQYLKRHDRGASRFGRALCGATVPTLRNELIRNRRDRVKEVVAKIFQN